VAQAERKIDPSPDPAPPAGPRKFAVGASLLRAGVVPADAMLTALAQRGREAGRLPDVLRARGLVVERDLLGVDARNWGIRLVDLDQTLPDPRLIDAVGVSDCLRHGLVPWRRVGDVTIVATSRPEDFRHIRPMLEDRLGPVAVGLASSRAVLAAIHARRGEQLATLAENRVPAPESCRSWPRLHRSPAALAGLLAIALATVLAPLPLGLAVLGFAALSLLLSVALKLAAVVAALRRPADGPQAPTGGILPTVSIIVAMYREGDIAPRLIRRLARLDYPAELLDVILAVEAEDHVTLDALARSELPPWMRVVIVPEGQVKTKPRALNHALDHARGAIIGVYDACRVCSISTIPAPTG
jgi:hypothetical protein